MMDQVQDIILPSCLDLTLYVPLQCHKQMHMLDAIMEKCNVCKVARYCSQAHSIQAWNNGRLCHKVMCPLLKR